MKKPQFWLLGVAVVVLLILFVLKMMLPPVPKTPKKTQKRANAATPRQKAAKRPTKRAMTKPKTKASCKVTKEVWAQYYKALQATRTKSKDGIYTELLAIKQSNKTLRWRKINGTPHVLMSTWTNYTGYPKPGKIYKTPPTFDIWVTAATQFQRSCGKDHKAACPVIRMKQRLGLPPNKKKTHVVTFWVQPKDIFRPCPDNGIDDSHCQLAFPTKATKAYKVWFTKQSSWLHPKGQPKQGLPWTELGYTYDWHPTSAKHIGLSEFILKRRANVLIEGIRTTAQFCRAAPL